MVPGLNKESYVERLKKLKLPTLSYRRIRRGMIQVFKLVNNMYDYDSTNILTFRDNSITSGNEKKKLFKQRPRIDLRKYSFTNRVVDLWNSLPDNVSSAKTVFNFEVRLDRHWKDQDITFNYEAQVDTKTRNIQQTEELVIQD